MDPTKIVVLGTGPGPIRGIIDVLTKEGAVELKTRDFLGDSMCIRRGFPTDIPDTGRRKTGAARIKRAAKHRRRCKG